MSEHEAAQAYGTITIVGGGCYGSFYLRQLGRARSVGALTWRQVVVVDKDPACRAAGLLREGVAPDAMLAVSEWTPYFRTYLDAASEGADVARDGIVPSPLMPHLMYEWLHDRAVARWPDRTVTTQPLPAAPPTPWERAAPNGIHYVSFATWMCPINCIEPATCPHTRGPRTWTMPAAAREFAETERLAGPALFHVTHRAYGVGMFDTRDVVAADALVRVAAQDGPAAVLVGTVSHCHGALAVLSISAPVTALR